MRCCHSAPLPSAYSRRIGKEKNFVRMPKEPCIGRRSIGIFRNLRKNPVGIGPEPQTWIKNRDGKDNVMEPRGSSTGTRPKRILDPHSRMAKDHSNRLPILIDTENTNSRPTQNRPPCRCRAEAVECTIFNCLLPPLSHWIFRNTPHNAGRRRMAKESPKDGERIPSEWTMATEWKIRHNWTW